MKKFVDAWNGTDSLDLYVEVSLLPGYPEKYPHLQVTRDLVNKMDEVEDIPTREIFGTHKPGNRGERRKATAKAKRHLKEIEPLTMSVRQTRNGGIIRKGDTWSWLPEWKKADRRAKRHEGKSVCRTYEDIIPREISLWDDDEYPGGTWDAESQSFLEDIEEEISPYFETVRYWEPDLGSHVVRETPNYDWAAMFLEERGLEEDFIQWLKGKEASHS